MLIEGVQQTTISAIDEGLYSRQLCVLATVIYVLGHKAMLAMSVSNVLIVGLKGLGIEIGVKSVTLHDNGLAEIADLSSQYYLQASDIGKPRAHASVSRLAELNSYVSVSVIDRELTEQEIGKYQVVVMTEASLAEKLRVNEITHKRGIKFIAAEMRGLFGAVFNDFGNEFVVLDQTGEDPVHGMIAGISAEEKGLVTCMEDHRHGLEDGDYVTFREVEGMEALNSSPPQKISVIGPYAFNIGDTRSLGIYRKGGIFTQVKQPKTLNFKSLKDSLENPEFVISDFAKFDRPAQLLIGMQALDIFRSIHGFLPLPRNENHAIEVVKLCNDINSRKSSPVDIDENLVKELAYQARGDLPPMAAVLGGLIAQEVLKACSGKFHPVLQHFIFDSLECLPTSMSLTERDCEPLGTRYDGIIAVLGREFFTRLTNARQFLVGAGAIGCEMLKNWAMLGLGSGSDGFIYLTDMDTIEKSNLNRQFLFRPKDVGKLKSECAAAAVQSMNPDLKGKIESFADRLGPETEDVFGDDFWESLTGVTNALDNVDARKHVDRRCVYYGKPLLESGTLGTKGNTQVSLFNIAVYSEISVKVVLPNLTESYSSSSDPPEKSIPLCTLKNFPNQIEHTIQWAREKFNSLFKTPAEHVNLYLSQENYISSVLKEPGTAKEIVEGLHSSLVADRPVSFEQCVLWARFRFEEFYANDIAQMLYNFPVDAVTSSGTPFWSGPKRAPTVLKFDAQDPSHLDYIIAAANLRAFNFGVKGERDPIYFKAVLQGVSLPKFAPKSGMKIQLDENENAIMESTDAAELEDLIKSLPNQKTLAGFKLHPCEFEKDDDTNFHIDFITAASNLRATNYSIANADRHKTKFIAGKIIPAIATTTALVAGLVCLELCKIIDGKSKIDDYKNGFVNLALPLFGFSEPIACPKFKYHETEWTLWDRFDVHGNLTLKQLIDKFRNDHELEITMLSSGVSMLYSFIMPEAKKKERLNMTMLDLIESVSKKPVPAYAKALVLEVCVNDREGKDVEVPYVLLNARGFVNGTAMSAAVCDECGSILRAPSGVTSPAPPNASGAPGISNSSHSSSMSSTSSFAAAGGSTSASFVLLNDDPAKSLDKDKHTYARSARLRTTGRLMALVDAVSAETHGGSGASNSSGDRTDSSSNGCLCVECASEVQVRLETALGEARREREAYAEYLAGLQMSPKASGPVLTSDDGAGGGSAEVQALQEQLAELVAESTRVATAVSAAEAALSQLAAEEREYWQHVNALQMREQDLAAHAQSLHYAHANVTAQLARLESTNVLNDAFRIWHHTPIASINGFRLGRLPGVAVEWTEINAALGQALLLVDILATKSNCTFKSYKLVPMGSFSRIEKIDAEKPEDKTAYEL
ncbi:hypothetical protein HDU83_004605 [Entophlyctis luteolus]|nr:hypothetical protein HDU83_004605 [Entophlyctis luteolus]